MYFIYDKAKTTFAATTLGQNKMKKVKVIALSTVQTTESANTYYINLGKKIPAHFLLDGTNIVKYNYNTTNAFLTDTKWKPVSEKVIDYEVLALPEEISNLISIQKKILTNPSYSEEQKPEEVIVFQTNFSIEDFYLQTSNAQNDSAFHYVIDNEKCYELIEPTKKCNKFNNKISVVFSTKNDCAKAIERVSKLVDQLMDQNNINNFNFVNAIDQNHTNVLTNENLNDIQLRLSSYRQPTQAPTTDAVTSTLKDEKNAGDHIIHICMLYRSDIHFVEVEKQLIQFLGEYLFYFEMETKSLYRLQDLMDNVGCVYYSNESDFRKLISSVDNALLQFKNDSKQIDIISTGLPQYDQYGHPIVRPFTSDTRDITDLSCYYTSSQKSINQDFDSYTVGSNIEMRSKFEDGIGAFTETVQMTYGYYEPVYPDLTVPPRNSTFLYNKGLMEPKEILKQMDQPHKPIIGKMPNAFDPYPFDDKIAQLEMHAPIVTLEYENASDINSNMLSFINNRFGNAEKRLVRIENLTATLMRYVARLSSRININCVYYGGQNVFGKYDCIRCMCDDLVNDAATRTLDQCLNCSRYEPVLGQFYEITGDAPGMAQIYDDIQASLMTKEEFANLNNVTDYSREKEEVKEDLTKLHIKKDTFRDYDDLLDEANNFVMDWTETPYHEQSPHVNKYEYNPFNIYKEKQERLKEIYEDGFKNQEQFKYERPQYGMNTIAGGNFNPFSSDEFGLNGLYNLSDYDIANNDIRIKIAAIAQEATDLGKQKKILYTMGAKIKTEYMGKTPKELVTLVESGTQVNYFVFEDQRKKDDASIRAVYFDCTSFVSYVYIHCGIIKTEFNTSSLINVPNFTVVKEPGLTLLEQLKQAYVGDIVLYNGHASIYAGGDEQWHASGDGGDNSRAMDTQVLKSKVGSRNDLVGIFRHNTLSKPGLKNTGNLELKTTLDNYAELQKGKSTGKDTNGDGYVDIVQDKAWINDINILKNYIDPSKRLTPELKMQFASIKALSNKSVITAEMIDAFLQKEKGGAILRVKGIKCDSNWEPVRDKNGELVWEEKNQFPRGQVWVEAGEKSGLNPLFLIAHCAGETGWCAKSNWTNYSGKFKSKDGRDYLFNPYSIWCYDNENFPSNPALHRATARKKCEENRWFTLEKAVIEGAKWIAESYIGTSAVEKYGRRDTAYFMKWHFGNLIEGQNGKPCTMQYATDVTWADQRAKMMYRALSNASMGREEALRYFEYLIPKFLSSGTQPATQQKANYNQMKDLGLFKLTFYCTGACCNGSNSNMTAHGHALHPGITIAVDKNIIPLGSWVYIETIGYRKACDVGGAINGNHIDVCVSSHDEANKLGVKNNIRVYLDSNYRGDC